MAGEAIFLGFLLLPDARRRLAVYLLLFAAGSLLSFFAARSLSASPARPILLCAAAFRLTLLFRPPDLSEDVFRYAWDGRVAATGISPYAFAPADPRVAAIAPELRSRVAHREFVTVYPPVAQAAFRFAAALPGDDVLALKALFGAADLAVVALLLAGGGAGARFGAAVYAFHPLAVTESAGQGHVDSLGVALLLASVVYIGRKRSFSAGVAFAASALTKYVPLAAALTLVRRGRFRVAGAALLVFLAVWGLAARAGHSPAGDLGAFASRWEFNSLAYPAAAALVETTRLPEKAKEAYIRWKEGREHRPWMQEVFPYFYTAFFARVVLASLLAVTLIFVAVRVADLELAVFASLAALLLASPTLHPWYLLWVLPFAAKRRNAAFLYLASVVPLAYGLLHPLPGLSPDAIRVVEYVPFALLLGWGWWKSWQGGPAPLRSPQGGEGEA